MPNIFLRIKAARDAIMGIQHPGGSTGWLQLFLPNTRIDYAGKVGEGFGSNVFMAPLFWIGRAFPEARVAVLTEDDDGEQDVDTKHDLAQLLNNPNPFCSSHALWMASVIYWCSKGDVYWLKARNGAGEVKQVWPIPYWMVSPKWDERAGSFIDYFEYRPGGSRLGKIAPEDMVHLKFGMNPLNVREGMSQMYSLLREIYTDDEAANFVAAIIKNGGVPGLVISPKDASSIADPSSIQAVKEYIKDKFSGDRRGEPLALGAPTEIQEFGYDPKKLDLSATRNVSEERVCAVLGLPAAVVGFGSGLEQTKVGSTMEELIRLAWYGCINPMQDAMAAELTRNLKDDFGLKDNQRVVFDRRYVQAMQGDKVQESERLSRAVLGGWMKVSEARKSAGLDVTPEDDIFLRPIGSIETGPGAPEEEPAPPAAVPPPLPVPPQEEEEGDEDSAEAKSAKPPELTRRQQRILAANTRIGAALQATFEKRLLAFFKKFGAAAYESWISVSKADSDELRIESMFSQMNMPKWEGDLAGMFGAHYVNVHTTTADMLSDMGLGVNLPDTVQLEVLGQGGTRAGLVDMTQSARDRALQTIRDAREEGLGVPDIARRLRDNVPAGPWTSPNIRSRVIARTETRFAQNSSALRCYESIPGVDRVMMLDNRLGDQGPNDYDMAGNHCADVNGMIVTMAEAEQLIAVEHPNGTRDMVPYFEED